MYSPDLVATQQEYLLAVKNREQLKNSTILSISQDGSYVSGELQKNPQFIVHHLLKIPSSILLFQSFQEVIYL
ncbi:MAG: hypothetical protein WCK54_10320 [Desulfuromonadales bacterium]